MARILVCDGETRAALATVRSLGRRGHEVHVVAPRRRSLAGASRYARSERVVGSAASAPREWLEGVESAAAEIGADWLLPVTEPSVGSALALGFRGSARLCAPPAASYWRAVDKWETLQLASEVGLDAPRSHLVRDEADLERALLDLGLPAVAKPRFSHLLRDDRWHSGGARLVSSIDEARAALAEPAAGKGLLIQEVVPGHGEGIFLLAVAGRTLVTAGHRRLREKPPAGGVSVLRVSEEPARDLRVGAVAMLERLAWTGIAMIEFRKTPAGRSALMEINPRPWGSLQLAIDSGVDFPALWLEALCGQSIAQPVMRSGIRSRWLMGDLDRLWIGLTSRRARAATGESVWRMLTDFLRSFGDGTRSEILQWDDPLPFVAELWGRLRGDGNG